MKTVTPIAKTLQVAVPASCSLPATAAGALIAKTSQSAVTSAAAKRSSICDPDCRTIAKRKENGDADCSSPAAAGHYCCILLLADTDCWVQMQLGHAFLYNQLREQHICSSVRRAAVRTFSFSTQIGKRPSISCALYKSECQPLPRSMQTTT